MDPSQATSPKATFAEQIRKFVPRNQILAAIVFEVIIFSILGGSSYTILSLTSKKKVVPVQTVQTQSSDVEVPTPEPSATPTSTQDIYSNVTSSPASPTPSATPTPNTLAGWLLYTNPPYSYSINYPPDWTFITQGSSDPKIPSYIVFNPQAATTSARSVTITVTTRTYQQELAVANVAGKNITVAGIMGTQQSLQDSNGNQTSRIIIPQSSFLFVFDAKSAYVSTLTQMLTSFKILK